jgi:cysteine-rich repeat protein
MSIRSFSTGLALIAAACAGSSGPPPISVASTGSAVCGDGRVDATEECDDGNASNEDACLTSCSTPARFVSADLHLHTQGCNEEVLSPAELGSLMAEEKIQIGSLLVWGVGYDQERSLVNGRDLPGSTPGLILHYDLEVSHFDAARGGHLIALGLRDLGFQPAPFATPTGAPVVEWGRAQGALVGMAHAQFWPAQGFPQPPGGCCMPWELPVHAARGRLDFLAVEKPGRYPVDGGAFRLWRSLLNAGFRVPLAAGSDHTCLNHDFGPRTPHTDVLLDGDVSYAGFLEALRLGRSSVALGRQHLDLRVNGARLGEEVQLQPGQTVDVAVETRLAKAEQVELLVNGRVEGRFNADVGHQVGRVSLRPAGSAWIAARSRSVATSAVYVIVGEREIRASADDACDLLRYVRYLAALRGRPAAYTEAEEELGRRVSESGGGTCS